MTALPSGTVTFVFSDIEGSTTLLKQLGDGYDRVLSDHRRLMRDTFTERDGVAGAREGEEERVPLRVDLDAAALGERLAHQPTVVGEDAVVAVTELLQERR